MINIVYQGSKNKLAKYIVPIIQSYIDNNNVQAYIELFGGGANIIDKIKCNKKIYIDINEDLVALLKYAKDNPNLEIAPENCSFEHLKDRVGEKKECYKYDHYCGDNNHLSDLKKQPKRYDPNKVQPSDVLEFNVVPNRNGKLHPTQKPIELLEWLVKTYSNENDVILDNCMGSGTTGVACKKLNRNFIGIELNEDYYNIAKERINNAN